MIVRMTMKTLKWTSFEHAIKKNLVQAGVFEQLYNSHLIVAVSGGADSIAALMFCLRIQKACHLLLTVIHIHHGKGGNQKFRSQSQSFVKKLCLKYKIPFIVKKHNGAELISEENMRDFRLKELSLALKKQRADFVITGHNLNDLLETRVMRLIRGTGPQGLQSMTFHDEKILRPLLMQSRKEIEEYLEKLGEKFIEDPSNLDQKFLRNWLRHHWLPDLEKRAPGSVEAFSRSLDLIVKSSVELKLPQDIWNKNGISRISYSSLDLVQKKKVVVEYLKKLKKRHFRHTQVEEIIKQLDKRQIEHKFSMLGLCWVVNAEQITVEF